uniref:Uncharacterized protein AlNc14C63G4551 n=1 Tax=Albugo laibachii Nc14 TaxID=890382 RepID=F0WD30_9STRA|nr:conserved hypothetical protein [Albugo laibachii Nc14]|eukprot:CCA19102.1 conserved hypothetical protein [Albugo laibachii Nc14]
MYERCSLSILYAKPSTLAPKNCTRGYMFQDRWFPGTCEGDIICHPEIASRGKQTEIISQAQPCPEVYVCDIGTSGSDALSHPCPGGYVCGPGTTPDLTLETPFGQLSEMCPSGYYCPPGTSSSQKYKNPCPQGYFCPTGTSNPYLGFMANDGMRRQLNANQTNPFLNVSHARIISDGSIRLLSSHDLHCIYGVDQDLELKYKSTSIIGTANANTPSEATKNNLKCARDHKWRQVALALYRHECDCETQFRTVHLIYEFWKCTSLESFAEGRSNLMRNLYGQNEAVTSERQCIFFNDKGGITRDISALIERGGIEFRTSWIETKNFSLYSEFQKAIMESFELQANLVLSSNSRIDPYLYDLFHAVNIINRYGDETLDIIDYATREYVRPLRLDCVLLCVTLKCPNGTSSAASSNDIEDCVATGTEVLARISLVPSDSLGNGMPSTNVSGPVETIEGIDLKESQVTTFTINTTNLSKNFTYMDHYQISIYQDCRPCPPRYICDLTTPTPTCIYPNQDSTTGLRLYEECLKMERNSTLCFTMPYFCETRTLFDNVLRKEITQRGCSECERLSMPTYFQEKMSDLGLPDDKHGYIQFSITAMARARILVVAELLHGMYVNDFREGFSFNHFDLNIFTPSKADYNPKAPLSHSILSVIKRSSFKNLMLPLNLPETLRRVRMNDGETVFETEVVSKLLLDRMSDIFVGDPLLPIKRGFVRTTQQEALDGKRFLDDHSGSQRVLPTEYFGLNPVKDAIGNIQHTDNWWDTHLNESSYMTIPYLPFFSNCRGYGSHVSISKLVESHPDCKLVPYNQTIFVDQYPWEKQLIPVADTCLLVDKAKKERGISLDCIFDENLEGGASLTRWKDHSVNPHMESNLLDWGRSSQISKLIGSGDLIAVQVGKAAGLQSAIPQEVYLTMTYYQISPGRKRIVTAEINFGRLCTPTRSAKILSKMSAIGIAQCPLNAATGSLHSAEYVLQIIWKPLDWFELMNGFQFSAHVYLILFLFVGLLTAFMGFAVWIINRCLTKSQNPPRFRFQQLLWNIFASPSYGVILATIPILIVCGVVYAWWHGFTSEDSVTEPIKASFESIPGDYTYQKALTQEQITLYKRGRVGTCFFVTGIYILVLGASLLIPHTLDTQPGDDAYREAYADSADKKTSKPDEMEGKNENELWKPIAWKRANFLLISVSFIVGLLIIWEFSYSSLFTKHIYLFLVLFKFIRGVIEAFLRKILNERLLVVPFLVVLATTEVMIVTAASEFIQFTIFYYFSLGLSLAERLYLAHFFQKLGVVLPSLARRLFGNRKLASKTANDDENDQQVKESDQDDDNEFGIECIIDGITGYCVTSTELFIAPLMSAFQLVFYDDTKIAEMYGVERNDLVYYILFGIFIIPSHTIMGVFELNTMELVREWKIYEYFSYLRHCFITRIKRWQLHYTKMDQNLHPTFQSLSLLCFSSQFYFLITLYSWGILLCVLSITMFLRADYSPFGDPITLLIIPLMVTVCWCIHRSSHVIGYHSNIWRLKGITVTLDDEVTTKLLVGGGGQFEQEQERLDLQAMNSDQFRHRFLHLNQPWILEHLKEMLTPRILATSDPENNFSADTIRNIYNDLINTEKKHTRQSDCSSDDEDTFEKLRRNWSSVPLQGASRDLMLFWIAKSRKRRSYGSVAAIILANNKQDSCKNCGGNDRVLSNWLLDTTLDYPDRNAIDALIDTFEATYGSQDSSSDLWKAFFRKEAKYVTLCDSCHVVLKEEGSRHRLDRSGTSPNSNWHINRSPRGAELDAARPGPASASIEKRLILQWLSCARQRLNALPCSNES